MTDDVDGVPARRNVLLRGGVAAAATAAAVAGAVAGSDGVAGAQTLVPVYLPVGPVRVYDSRNGDGPISPGQVRTLVGGTQPEDLAQCFNLTVVGTVNAGFLAVYPADQAYAGTSSINWFTTNQIAANNAYTAFRASDGAINVLAGGTGPTQFVLDLVAVLTLVEAPAVAAATVDGSSTPVEDLAARYRRRAI